MRGRWRLGGRRGRLRLPSSSEFAPELQLLKYWAELSSGDSVGAAGAAACSSCTGAVWRHLRARGEHLEAAARRRPGAATTARRDLIDRASRAGARCASTSSGCRRSRLRWRSTRSPKCLRSATRSARGSRSRSTTRSTTVVPMYRGGAASGSGGIAGIAGIGGGGGGGGGSSASASGGSGSGGGNPFCVSPARRAPFGPSHASAGGGAAGRRASDAVRAATAAGAARRHAVGADVAAERRPRAGSGAAARTARGGPRWARPRRARPSRPTSSGGRR